MLSERKSRGSRREVDVHDDAVDAARFYERHGFVPAAGHPLRLYRRMKDIRSSLDQAGHGEGP